MNLALEFTLAVRYSLGQQRSRGGRFITMLAVLGLVLGTALLIAVFAVMNGFEREMRERILALVPHIRLEVAGAARVGPGELVAGDGGIGAEWRGWMRQISAHPQVRSVSPYRELTVLYRHRGRVEPGILFALDSEHEAGQQTAFARAVGGELLARLHRAPGGGVILGRGLAERLGLAVGERVRVLVFGEGRGALRGASFPILGLLRSGTELDQSLGLVHFAGLAAIPRQATGPAGLRVQVDEVFAARAVGRELRAGLPAGFALETWQQRYGNLYEAIEMSRSLVSLIVLLILAIAAFNLVATLMIAAADRQGEVAMLKALGAGPASLARVFALQGLLTGLAGGVAGGGLGVILALNLRELAAAAQAWAGVQLLDSAVYPIDYLPADLHWGQAVAIVGVAVVLSGLAALYPAGRVARLAPAQVLRYEY